MAIVRRAKVKFAARTGTLTLETELAKAKEQVLSSIMEVAPRSVVPNPINLESRKGERKVEAPIISLETK